MAYSRTYRTLQVALSVASLAFFGAVATASAQSRVAETRAAAPSAVAKGTSNGTAAIQKRENSRASSARLAAQNRKAVAGSSAAAAPVALALEDAGPGPSSNPEPLSILLIGGALAGLYGVRRHLS